MRSSIQVAGLRRYGVLSSIKRWAWEKMKVWTIVVAAPAVSCCPCSSSFALLDVSSCGRLHLVDSKMSSSARMLLPPHVSYDYSFWEHRCEIRWVGTGSVSGWVGICGRQVGDEGDCGKYREG